MSPPVFTNYFHSAKKPWNFGRWQQLHAKNPEFPQEKQGRFDLWHDILQGFSNGLDEEMRAKARSTLSKMKKPGQNITVNKVVMNDVGIHGRCNINVGVGTVGDSEKNVNPTSNKRKRRESPLEEMTARLETPVVPPKPLILEGTHDLFSLRDSLYSMHSHMCDLSDYVTHVRSEVERYRAGIAAMIQHPALRALDTIRDPTPVDTLPVPQSSLPASPLRLQSPFFAPLLPTTSSLPPPTLPPPSLLPPGSSLPAPTSPRSPPSPLQSAPPHVQSPLQSASPHVHSPPAAAAAPVPRQSPQSPPPQSALPESASPDHSSSATPPQASSLPQASSPPHSPRSPATATTFSPTPTASTPITSAESRDSHHDGSGDLGGVRLCNTDCGGREGGHPGQRAADSGTGTIDFSVSY